MQTTASVKLLPTKAQEVLIKSTMKEYIKLVNSIVDDFVGVMENLKYTSKDVPANLPSALKNQAIQDASSIFKKYKKEVTLNAKSKKPNLKEVKVPILKKEVSIWNNQNFNVENGLICFPVMVNGKSCLLYTSDAADEVESVDLGGSRIINVSFFKQKTAYEIMPSLVGSEMCIRDRSGTTRISTLKMVSSAFPLWLMVS